MWPELTDEQRAQWPDTWPALIMPQARLPEYYITMDEATVLLRFPSRPALYKYMQRHSLSYLIRWASHRDLVLNPQRGFRPYRLGVLTRKEWRALYDCVYRQPPSASAKRSAARAEAAA